MARNDIDGFFWNDTPPPKPPPKAKPKRNPPPRTWELPDYLPHLDEARSFKPNLFNDSELIAASCEWGLTGKKHRLVFDIETYPNYFLVVFQSVTTGQSVYFELGENRQLDKAKMLWIMQSFCLISFNGRNYDVPIAALAIAGKSNAQLMAATEEIILRNERAQNVLRQFKVKKLKCDHIDLIEVAPLEASLKIYAGRLHAKRMQDLPFVPGSILSEDQITITRWYCFNDTENTILLYKHLEEQIQLREALSLEYGIDVRSHSDAQISEAVIGHEVAKMNGGRSERPNIPPGTSFRYQIPSFVKFDNSNLQWVLEQVRVTDFVINDKNEVGKPASLENLAVPIGKGIYRMGIGGLHSSEEKAAHIASDDDLLLDIDVASNYPRIIINQKLFPTHLGINFVRVYENIVNRRLDAKEKVKAFKKLAEQAQAISDILAATGHKAEARKWAVIADCLKIVVNGGFGKLGSSFSILFAPHLMIQVTLTGQLALLMLIARFEAIGIPVVSANTDGIVIKCPKTRYTEAQAIIKQWEADCDFETEETRYKGIYSRDVNNYFAVKTNNEVKVKGTYAERGSAGNSVLSKNPTGLICADAVMAFLTTGIPISRTIRGCKDITRFVVVRAVKGGAVKDGEYLGKAIRWYYATGVTGEIIYALNGNTVPRSQNAKPLMVLPDLFPEDTDFDWYEQEAYKILQEIGYEIGI